MALSNRRPNTAPGCFTGVGARAFLLVSIHRSEGFGTSFMKCRGHTGPLFLYSQHS